VQHRSPPPGLKRAGSPASAAGGVVPGWARGSGTAFWWVPVPVLVDPVGRGATWSSAQPWRCLWRWFSQITMTRP